MTDAPGEGFEVGAAYVQVTPDADDFQEQVEAIVGETDVVVQVPVVPDAGDFRAALEEQVSAGDTAVTVPVVPDTAGFRLLLEDATEGSGAQPVTVPVTADPADLEAVLAAAKDELDVLTGQIYTARLGLDDKAALAELNGLADQLQDISERVYAPDVTLAGADEVIAQLDAIATAAGTEGAAAGEAFSSRFLAATAQADLFPAAGVTGQAAEAGEAAGVSFGERFATAGEQAGAEFSAAVTRATGQLSLFGPEAEAEAGTAGEAAGAAFSRGFGAQMSLFTAAQGKFFAGAEDIGVASGAEMGEAAGLSFSERFSAVVSRAQVLAGSAAGFVTQGAEDGEAAGASFIGRMKSVISGGMGSIEFLLGAGFVAATAIMANSFQEAMERLHTQAGVAQSAIAPLSGAVLNLASQVGESPSGLAQALYHVESAFQSTGITGQKAMAILQTAAEGARVGGSDLVDTTNALDAIMVAALPGIHSYAQAMGAVNAIVGSGDMTMQDFASAASSGIFAVAKTYGQSLPEIGAALATFGDNNIRGAKAATDLRMSMQALFEPVDTATAALDRLGLSTSTLGNTLAHQGLVAAIGQFIEHLKAAKVPMSEWAQYETEIFGKRAGVGIGILVAQYARLQGKLSDIAGATHKFGSAWAATEATTSQKVHNLEAGFEALMVRIGQGLLPYLDDIFTAITKALPSIERFGSAFAKIASPVVKSFFTGLGAVFRVLFGPLKDLTIAVGAFAAAWLALDAVMAVNPFVAIGIALITLTGAVIRYHKQIFDFIRKTWHDIASFFSSMFGPVFGPVEKIFDAIRSFITGSFDGWWKSHGEELEEVWKSAWEAISGVFRTTWDTITTVLATAWALVGPFLTTALDVLKAYFEITWDAIAAYVKTAWDLIAAVVKIGTATVETVIRVAWDLITGIFDVFLDLITGHWSQAWKDVETTATQIWNAIKGYLSSVWDAISTTATQIWNNIKGFLSGAWDTIKSTAESVFSGIRSFVASIWDGMVSDAEAFASKITGVISSIVHAIPGGGLISSGLGALGIHLAGGGVVPGYAPGRDSIPAVLSPGEGVLTPEAVRGLGGPGFVHAANARFAGGRAGMAYGGVIPSFASPQRFADGGLAGWGPLGAAITSDGLEAVLDALVQALSGQQGYGAAAASRAAGPQVEVNFYSTSPYPSPEQVQGMTLAFTSAISNA